MADSNLSFLRQWMNAPDRFAALVVSYLKKSGFKPNLVRYEAGAPIVREGHFNDLVYILLDGLVRLSKTSESGLKVDVAELRPGSLVGLVSFVTQREALTSATPAVPSRLIRMTREEFDQFSTYSPEMTRLSQNLILGNMLDRYDHILSLHVELEHLNAAIETERNHLQTALRQLEEAQNRLVSQEKMAFLGELVAGVAHEINNPTAALMRAAEHLGQSLPELCRQEGGDAAASLFEFGLQRTLVDTAHQRRAMEVLEQNHPELLRPTLRLMSQLQTEPLEALLAMMDTIPSEEREKAASRYLAWFEAGSYLKNIRTASSRIANLVKSLKSYSRQDRGVVEWVDLREGLRDTLTLLGSKLQDVEVVLDLPDIPPVRCNVAEINQVWTNILSNASEAMGGQGRLEIRCGRIDGGVYVGIEDYGPGIGDDAKAKIFQPNYTTKHTDTEFGLGLGLAISSEIIQKNGGTIHVEDAKGHSGARFVVQFPVVV